MIIGITSADFVRADNNPTGIDQWGGSGWARIGQYVPFMREAGHTVVTGILWDNDNHLEVEDSDGVMHAPDLILSQRLMHDNLDKSYKSARQAGQIIVNDVDDWYWGLSPQNDAFYHSHPKHNTKENTTFYRASLAASSYLTVSTPYLAQRLRNWSRMPIQILPNYVDVTRFRTVPITDSTVPEVGWAGSTSHRSGDIETVAGILRPMQSRDEIRLVHAGAYPYSPSYASKLGVDDESVRTNPRCGHEHYPVILDFEVGIVPLRSTAFNDAKSDIKGLEYAASGIPFVAAMSPAYKDLYGAWTDLFADPGFYLAKNGSDWTRKLTLLRDPETRQTCQDMLLENVKSRDVTVGARQYISYLEGLVPR
jgi:glycosyltransferase involved in cell wall biosynthesis